MRSRPARSRAARRSCHAGLAAVLTAAAILLSGCGATTERTDLHLAAAARLQEGVLALTQAVAAERYDAAEGTLQEVRGALLEAADEGQVSAGRYRLIDDALDRVAAELAAAREARAAEVAAEQAAAGQAAAEQAAAEQPAAEQAETGSAGGSPAPAAPGPEPPSGNAGPGNNNGNGNGGNNGKGNKG